MREAPKDFDYSSEIEKYENEVRVIKEKILKNDKIVSECKKINEERRKNRGVNLKWKK